MYFLINSDSNVSFNEQLATADGYLKFTTAKHQAIRRFGETGDRWTVVKIEKVYTVEAWSDPKKDEGPDHGKLWSDTSAELL